MDNTRQPKVDETNLLPTMENVKKNQMLHSRKYPAAWDYLS
jgi:hypothetical protein